MFFVTLLLMVLFQYVSEVVIGAPYTVSDTILDQFKVRTCTVIAQCRPPGIPFQKIDIYFFPFHNMLNSISKCNFGIFSISYLILRHFGHALMYMSGQNIFQTHFIWVLVMQHIRGLGPRLCGGGGV